MRTLIIILIAIILIGGGYYWYTQQSSTDINVNLTPEVPTTITTTEELPTSTSPETPMETAPLKEFSVTNSGFNFNPNAITVNQGDRVRITFTNGGGTHDFRVDTYDVGTNVISTGQSETFEFVASEAGEFEFYCSVGNHRAMGMVGTLTVNP